MKAADGVMLALAVEEHVRAATAHALAIRAYVAEGGTVLGKDCDAALAAYVASGRALRELGCDVRLFPDLP